MYGIPQCDRHVSRLQDVNQLIKEIGLDFSGPIDDTLPTNCKLHRAE